MSEAFRNPRGFLNQVVSEANQMKSVPEPTWGDWWNATVPGRAGWGLLAHRDKDEAQRLNDLRHDYVLSRLVDAWGDPTSDKPTEQQLSLIHI